MVMLDREALVALRDECFADDIDISDDMLSWTMRV